MKGIKNWCGFNLLFLIVLTVFTVIHIAFFTSTALSAVTPGTIDFGSNNVDGASVSEINGITFQNFVYDANSGRGGSGDAAVPAAGHPTNDRSTTQLIIKSSAGDNFDIAELWIDDWGTVEDIDFFGYRDGVLTTNVTINVNPSSPYSLVTLNFVCVDEVRIAAALGDFNIDDILIESPTGCPQANADPTTGSVSVENVTQEDAGQTSYTFSVQYLDSDSGIDVSTIDTNDVTINNGVAVVLAIEDSGVDGSPKTALYIAEPPGGAWDETDNGTYTISLAGSEVCDINGTPACVAADASLATFTVSMDTTAPGAPTVNGTSPTTDSTPTWSWSSGGGGDGTYRYKLDDADLTFGASTTTSTSFTPSSALSDGSHTLYVQERDDAGNWSESGSKTINIDATPPNAPAVSGPSPTNDTTPTWTWTGDSSGGSGNYRYKLDDSNLDSGATETTSTTYTSDALADGSSHTLYVQERDAIGNWSESGSKTIVIDTTPPGAPTVNGTTPTNVTTPTWSWDSGGGGNGNYRYKLDDADLSSGASTTTSTSFTPSSSLSDGSHTLYVQERDAAGNWSDSGSKTIVIDTTPPGVPTVDGTTPTNDNTPTWTWTSGGGGNGNYRYELDDDDLTSGAETTTLTSFTPADALTDGSHILYVQERDAAGNWSESGSKTINIDATPPNAPAVSGTSPTNDTTPTWSWTGDSSGGSGNYRYKLDDSNLDSGATETTSTTYTSDALADGSSHTLYVQERDTIGNWSESGSKTIVIDTTPPGAPTVNGTTPTNVTTPTWSWDSGGGGNGNYRYKMDDDDLTFGASTTTSTSFTPSSSLSEAPHTLYVQERDDAGNWSESGSKTIVIDTTPPGAPTVNGTTPTNDNTPTWTWTSGGGGNGNYRYELDDDDLTSGASTTTSSSFTPSSALSDGSHTLYVQERDDAGNWSESGSKTISIDATPPNAPTVSGSSPTNDTTPTWNWTGDSSGGSGNYRYKLDDSNLDSGATETTSTTYTSDALADGSYTLYVQERDEIGNWSESGSKTINVDTSGPSVTINQADSQADPAVSSINFTAVFSEAVSGFANDDIDTSTSTASGTLSAEVTQSGPMNGTTYTVEISGMIGEGDVIATIVQGAAQDAAGNLSASSTSTDNTVAYLRDDYLVSDFGAAYGLYRYDPNKTPSWAQLSPIDPNQMVTVDIDEENVDELVVSFYGYGVYIYDGGWTTDPITPVIPEAMLRYGNQLVCDFGSTYGLYRYDPNETPSWAQLSPIDPHQMVTVDIDEDSMDELVVSFNGWGVYIYDGGWTTDPITPVIPEAMLRYGNQLVCDFGNAYGLYRYDPDETPKWDPLSPIDPNQMVTVDIDEDNVDELVVSFNGYGVYIHDGGWSAKPITPLIPEAMLRFGNQLVFDFGSTYGLYRYDPDETPKWDQLSPIDPNQMLSLQIDNDIDAELAVSFIGWGLYIYDGGWAAEPITKVIPEGMMSFNTPN